MIKDFGFFKKCCHDLVVGFSGRQLTAKLVVSVYDRAVQIALVCEFPHQPHMVTVGNYMELVMLDPTGEYGSFVAVDTVE